TRRGPATRARDRAHRRREAHPALPAARPPGRPGRPPGDRHPLPPRRALAESARDPQGRGLLEGAEPPGRDRRLERERGFERAEILRSINTTTWGVGSGS